MSVVENEFRRPETAQAAVLAEIRRLILDGQLGPGSPVRQDAIAASLGVSRVPVREALKILEGEGQITYRPHRGYFVHELTERDVHEIYRMRELLEGEALRVGVPKLTAGDLEAMAECLERMGEGAGTAALSEWNSRFHLTMLSASGMPHMLKHIRLLRGATDAYRSLYYMSDHALETVNEEHRQIFEAASARDAERVVAVTKAHHAHTIEALRDHLLEG